MQETGRARCKTSSYSHDEIGKNKRNAYFTAMAAIPAQLCPLLSTIRRILHVCRNRRHEKRYEAGLSWTGETDCPYRKTFFPDIPATAKDPGTVCAKPQQPAMPFPTRQDTHDERKKARVNAGTGKKKRQNKCPHGFRTCGHRLMNRPG